MPPIPSWPSTSSSTSWSRSAAAGLTQLFGPATQITPPAIAWNALSFHAVDDRVRGGSSQSHAQLTAKSGQLLFSGYLDTTTLGGAGFASQQYGASPAFPITLEPAAYQGLELRVIPQKADRDTDTGLPSQQGTSTGSSSISVPGGGRGPVTSYVFNVYTSIPQRRPDGRRESSIVYEYHFDVGSAARSPAEQNDGPQPQVYRPQWSDFKPTYRGKPKPDAAPLKPEEIQLWSMMARSDFGSQSGPFALVVDSIWARRTSDSAATQTSEKGLSGRGVSQQGEWAPQFQQSLQPGNTSGARGFALYALTTMAFVAWIFWAVLPDAWLHALGIDWYPSREWAYLIPAWSMMAVLFTYAAYLALNLRMTPKLDDVTTFTDDFAKPYPLPRASDMTLQEAQHFYDEGHPMRGADPEEMLSRATYDLPPGSDAGKV